MFRCDDEKQEKAATIATWLASRQEFLSHGRHISRDALEEKGMLVKKLESNHTVQDLCLSVFHATTHTFGRTKAAKIIENHKGRTFIKAWTPPNS